MRPNTTKQMRLSYFYLQTTEEEMENNSVSCQCEECHERIWFLTQFPSDIPDAVRCPYCHKATLTPYRN